MTYCSSLVAACLNVMAECDVVSLCTDTCIMRNIHVLFCYYIQCLLRIKLT